MSTSRNLGPLLKVRMVPVGGGAKVMKDEPSLRKKKESNQNASYLHF